MRLLAALFFSSLAAASALPRKSGSIANSQTPQNITIVDNSIRFRGDACEGARAPDVVVGLEKETVTFGFNGALVALGDGATDMSCSISMKIQYPPGCAKANLKATYLGFVQADRGASTSIQSWYTLSTGEHLFPPKKPFKGPKFANGSDLQNEDLIEADISKQQPHLVEVFAQFKIGVDANGRKDAVATMTVDHLTLTLVNRQIGVCP